MGCKGLTGKCGGALFGADVGLSPVIVPLGRAAGMPVSIVFPEGFVVEFAGSDRPLLFCKAVTEVVFVTDAGGGIDAGFSLAFPAEINRRGQNLDITNLARQRI